MSLNRIQLGFLRGKADSLTPVVTVGNAGLSEAVMAEVEFALTLLELIKIKVGSDDRDLRNSMYAEICERTSAVPVQQIGKMVVIYREGGKSRITLP